ncbi:MAG: hypothetical protein ACM33T_17320 [Solirubrobacterales bacterium]
MPLPVALFLGVLPLLGVIALAALILVVAYQLLFGPGHERPRAG